MSQGAFSIRESASGWDEARKKIYNDEGLVLLADGIELTDALIKRLAKIDIGYVYVEDAYTDDVVITTMLHDETRNQALKVIRNQFQEMSGASGITKGFYHLDKNSPKSWTPSWMICPPRKIR